MDRNLQLKTLLQDKVMLLFENEILKIQRNMDMLQMQSGWKRLLEGFLTATYLSGREDSSFPSAGEKGIRS